MDIATWQLPSGYSANRVNNKISRIAAYRFKLKHYLKDGSRVIPHVTTVQYILQAYDMLEMQVAIEEGSFYPIKN
tara:strand:+ start:613 stop:837 length:225 start_codon:yes stop_codon:yes gene_type:complete